MTTKNKNGSVKQELKNTDFRVAIFGSARIKPEDKVYKGVYRLAKEIGKHGFDVITGGGPGLMEAANAGHEEGDKKNRSDDIGLTIQLPWEADANKHLEIKKHFNKFSGRLDTFMALSNVMIIVPGGIGTCLELFYSWQLIQVRHINPIPIILVGKMWSQLISWVKKYPLKDGLISPGDLKNIHIVKSNKEAMEIIMKTHKNFQKNKKTHSNNHYLK
ncbi:MAG: LOG family protein [bacterium]|nr:LOG family protein [bacterium]